MRASEDTSSTSGFLALSSVSIRWEGGERGVREGGEGGRGRREGGREGGKEEGGREGGREKQRGE